MARPSTPALQPGNEQGVTMDDLTAFITARLDEDEAAAKACNGPFPWKAADDEDDSWIVKDAAGEALIYDEGTPSLDEAKHIARHDPARVIREVTAKRAVLAWYADSVDASKLFKEKLGTGTHMAAAAESYLNVMRGYAAVWPDHPDYKQEWAL